MGVFSRSKCFLAVLLVTVLSAWLSGCYSKIKGWSEESFRQESFTESVINHEGLALLPVIVLMRSVEKTPEKGGEIVSAPYAPGKSAESQEEKQANAASAYRIILNETLLSQFQSKLPAIRLITPGDALIRFNDAGLAAAYSKFDTEFTQTGLDANTLQSFGKALNSRFLFISIAVISEYKTDASMTFIWTIGRKSEFRSVKISGQIWDTETCQQLWEGSGVGYNRLAPFEGSPLLEEMSSQAVKSLLEAIFR